MGHRWGITSAEAAPGGAITVMPVRGPRGHRARATAPIVELGSISTIPGVYLVSGAKGMSPRTPSALLLTFGKDNLLLFEFYIGFLIRKAIPDLASTREAQDSNSSNRRGSSSSFRKV